MNKNYILGPDLIGGSRLLHPIHDHGVFQSSDIISNLIGSMRRMVAAEGGSFFKRSLEKSLDVLSMVYW